jgi:hypothetical protein
VPGQWQVLAAPLLEGRAPVVYIAGDQVAECLEAIPRHPLREVMKGGALLIGGGSLLPASLTASAGVWSCRCAAPPSRSPRWHMGRPAWRRPRRWHRTAT